MQQQIEQLLTSKPRLRTIEVAAELRCDELSVVKALPQGEAKILPAEMSEQLLRSIATWGKVTCIIEVAGFVFEVKAPLPSGKNAYGYYNLSHDSEGLQGHLKLDNVGTVAQLIRKVRGKNSYYFQFFDKQGDSIFKIYLGRDQDGNVIAEQISQFNAIESI